MKRVDFGLNSLESKNRGRTYVIPLVVMLVAVALLIWSRTQNKQKAEQVQQFVRQICTDIAAGRDVAGKLNPDDSIVEQRTIEQLRQLCPDSATAWRVEIRGVDPQITGATAAGSVTHAVILRLNDDDRLGLLVAYSDDLRVTGYWLPSP